MHKESYKTQEFSSSGVYIWEGINRFNGTKSQIVTPYNSSAARVQYVDVRDTEDSPDWRNRIQKGFNATGRLTGSRIHFRTQPFSALRRQQGVDTNYVWKDMRSWTGYTGLIQQPPFYSDVGQLSSAQNLALQSFYQQAVRAQRQLQALVSVAEAGKTARGIRDAGKRLMGTLLTFVKGAYALKRGHFGRYRLSPKTRAAWRKRALQEFPNMWLTYALEVSPLVGEIDDWCKALARDKDTVAPRIAIKATGESTGPFTSTLHSIVKNGLTHTVNSITFSKATCSVYGAVKCIGPDVPAYRYAGVSWRDVIPAAYELVPYSFVVDYFTNLGDIIDAMAFQKAGIAWASQTDRTSTIKRVFNLSPPNSGLGTVQATCIQGQEEVEVTTVNRRPLDEVPVPGITFQIPGLRQSITVAALASSLARLYS